MQILRLASLTILALAIAAPGASAATQRYASPSGSGTACSSASPCEIAQAITGAQSGDEVVVEPGDHSLTATPPVHNQVTIRGIPGQPRPRLVFSGYGQGGLFVPAGNVLRNLEIVQETPATYAVFASGASVDQVVVKGSSASACATHFSDSTVRNSIVVASGAGASAICTANGAGHFRNVTAVATGSGGVAIEASAHGASATTTVELVKRDRQGRPGRREPRDEHGQAAAAQRRSPPVTRTGRATGRPARMRTTPNADGQSGGIDHMLRGFKHLRLYRESEIANARAAFQCTIALDPMSARAHAGLAFTHLQDYFWGNDLDGFRVALPISERALSLDRDEPWAHWVLALALVKNRRHDEACRLLERATTISPGSADIATMRGICLVHAGRHDEAIPWLTLAVRLDPFQPDWALEFLGMAQLLKHRYREAISEFGRIVDPPSWICALVAACHALLGEANAASEQLAAYHRVLKSEHSGRISTEENAIQMRMDIATYKEQEDQNLQIDAFRSAGIHV